MLVEYYKCILVYWENRWLKERPDVVYLYHNEHWKRPKNNEKPLNHKKIENGCYW